MTDSTPTHSVQSLLLGLACIVIIIAGLKSAANILVPFLLSVFIGVLSLPLLRWMTRYRVPAWLAVILIVLLLLGIFTLSSSMLNASTAELRGNIGIYRDSFNQVIARALEQLGALGIDVSVEQAQFLQPGEVLSWIGVLFSSLSSVLVNFIVIIFIVAFILLEASTFPHKLSRAFSTQRVSDYVETFIRNVQKYLFIKSWISLATGITAGTLCWLIGLEFPLLWGMLAFFLNFVPSIGSLLAAIPPMTVALATGGWTLTLYTALVFVFVNVLYGNIIEPRVMGAYMGLSPLVVFSSLIIWGWIFGPVGVLLAVPLTMVVHISLQSHPDTHWLAVLLGR